MTAGSRSDLAKILRQRRVTASLTLQKLAVMTGVSSSHLGHIERGERLPSPTVLNKIAKPLGFQKKGLLSLAGYLSPCSSREAGKQTEIDAERLDPYVAMVLSQEPLEVQCVAVRILSILKSIAEA